VQLLAGVKNQIILLANLDRGAVRGLRPRRARLVLGVKVPNPRSSTRSPRASPAPISLKRTPTASAMSSRWIDGCATASRRISSDRVMAGWPLSSRRRIPSNMRRRSREGESGPPTRQHGQGRRNGTSIGAQLSRPDIEFSFSCQFADQDDAGDRQYQDHDKTHQRGSLPRVLIPCAAFVHSALPSGPPGNGRPDISADAPPASGCLHRGAPAGSSRINRRHPSRQHDPFRQ
jgi:hypothetical protein